MEKALHPSLFFIGPTGPSQLGSALPPPQQSSILSTFFATLVLLTLAVAATLHRILSSCGRLPPLEEQIMIGGDDLAEVLARCAVTGTVIRPPLPSSSSLGGDGNPHSPSATAPHLQRRRHRTSSGMPQNSPSLTAQLLGGIGNGGLFADVGTMEDAADSPTQPPPTTLVPPLGDVPYPSSLPSSSSGPSEAGTDGWRWWCRFSETVAYLSSHSPVILSLTQAYDWLRMDYSFLVEQRPKPQRWRRQSIETRDSSADTNLTLALWWYTQYRGRNESPLHRRRRPLHTRYDNDEDEEGEETPASRMWPQPEDVDSGLPLLFHCRGEAPLLFDHETNMSIPVAYRDSCRESYDAHQHFLHVSPKGKRQRE